MAKNKVRMVEFIISVMEAEFGNTSLRVDEISKILTYILSKYELKNYFNYDNNLDNILSVVVDYPEVFRMSKGCYRIELCKPDMLQILEKEYKVPSIIKRKITEYIRTPWHSNCLLRHIDEYNTQMFNIITNSTNYIDGLCLLLESNDVICTDKFKPNNVDEVRTVYLSTYWYKILDEYYKRNLKQKLDNDGYIFSYKWRDKDIYIQIEHIFNEKGYVTAYKIFVTEKPDNCECVPYFPNICLKIDDTNIQKKKNILRQLEGLFKTASEIDVSYESIEHILKLAYEGDK